MTHDALVRTSEIAVTAVVLVLAVLLLGSLRRMPRNRRWLVVLACLLLYAVIVVPGAAVLWFAAFPLLAGVYPDGVMTPRWLWLPVGALAPHRPGQPSRVADPAHGDAIPSEASTPSRPGKGEHR